MGSPLDSSSGLWTMLGQASNVVQLVGVDALGLVSMVVQAALAARRHRDACLRLAQHVEVVGGLLRELELAELMRREATRRPLEKLSAVLRRCYKLATACQDCRGGYLGRLFWGTRMAEELRAAEQEIDMFIRLVPLIALVDTTYDRQVMATERMSSVVASSSTLDIRIATRVKDFNEVNVRGASVPFKVGEQFLEGKVDLQEQEIMDVEKLVNLCTDTGKRFPRFKEFGFFDIVDSTENFSEKIILGKGGYGTVYKGQLSDGTVVAIKRLEENATLFDFNSELQLASLQHVNVIRLLGWCVHGKERILVYEFMHRGSLDHQIFEEKTRRALLNWHRRLQIIKGIAKGLVYMHKHSLLYIVHGDLKPNNILLDNDMNPKIADFGSARILSSDVVEEQTSRVVGTSGYIAPEYASRGLYSVKTDVFSFGVLALVIISGRKNTILHKQGDAVGNLVRDAWHLWNDGRLHELVDPLLNDGYDLDEIVRCAQVALLCAQENSVDRPTMSDVVALLNFENISLLPVPKQPSELTNGGATGDKVSTGVGQSSRTIDITITSSAPVSTRVRIVVDPET